MGIHFGTLALAFGSVGLTTIGHCIPIQFQVCPCHPTIHPFHSSIPPTLSLFPQELAENLIKMKAALRQKQEERKLQRLAKLKREQEIEAMQKERHQMRDEDLLAKTLRGDFDSKGDEEDDEQSKKKVRILCRQIRNFKCPMPIVHAHTGT